MLLVVLFAAILLGSCTPGKNEQTVFKSSGRISYPVSTDDEMMLDSIQRATFQFFMHEIHPEWGITKDRAASWSPSSIASTGFAIPVYAVGAERNWITREEAARNTLNILRFFDGSLQSADTNATGYKGFYYHFLRMDTGTRAWQCELSSIDSGLLFMGMIFARNYYNQDTEEEKEIRRLVAGLLGRLDWSVFDMPEGSTHPHTISMGWKPESGPINWGWHGYNEGLFLYILAAGTGMQDVERSYDAWLSYYKWKEPYPGLAHVAFPPLFGHQFSHIFIDFRGIADKYMREKGIDYFENSRRATLAQQQYAIQNIHGWKGYDSLTWGITASDGPGSGYNAGGREFYAYAGRGASGPDYNYFDDGTIAPYASLSSLPFAPEIVFPTIRNIIARHGQRIWGKYGFYDAFNETADWVNDDFIGIAQGPMLLMIENFRSGLVWDYVMKDPVIQDGMTKLGFSYLTNKK
ncbi:MAG: Tat pathway signal protein [Bacteroidetes bacterium]|nr:Tat pathway signal protein [Bacteroidota bacterium]